MKPVDEKGNIKAGSTHDKFTSDMAEKTAINKACKYVINSSGDESIVAKFARQMDSEISEAEVEAEIDEKANKEVIDVESEQIIDVEPETENQPETPAEQVSMDVEGPGY
jgi:recombination protein RecT